MKKLILLTLAAILAGCEAPVDPAKIRVVFGPQIVTPQDSILIASAAPAGALQAEPGESLSLDFNISNRVRDDVFLKFDESTAYVASIVVFMPGQLNGRILPESAPSVNPAASAGSYKRLLASHIGADNSGPDRTLHVALPVELPRFDWERAEISVVFSVRGYTRETRGEFRDTVTKTYVVTRRKPAAHAASDHPTDGFFLRPASNPATLPGR